VRRFLRRFHDFWFADAPAARLATLRILIGAFSLLDIGLRYPVFSGIADTSPTLFQPVGLASFLAAPIPGQVFRLLVILTLVANVAFLLGWRYRYSGPLFAGLLLGVLCYRNSWSMIYHSDNLLVLHVLILGFAPAADAFSLDALARSRLAKRATGALNPWPARDPAGAWEYGFPIRLMCAVTTVTYFLAAVAKVAGPMGWTWATGEALRSQIAVDAVRKEILGSGAQPLFFLLYEYLPLFSALAIGSLVLELGAPAVLLSGVLSRWWVVGALLMHWGIFFLMGILFEYHLSGLAFASFFDLERLAAWLGFRPDLARERAVRHEVHDPGRAVHDPGPPAPAHAAREARPRRRRPYRCRPGPVATPGRSRQV
jgi:vitamin K-dependent gamma-carboxylase-like protein